MSLPKTIALGLLAAAGAIAPGGARADTTLCTEITSLPANLNAQGVYCLNASLVSSSADASQVWIGANNVTLDCNGHTIRDGAGNTYAIRNTAFQNATVRNCVIEGFDVGIDVGGDGALVEDNVVRRAAQIGIRTWGNAAMIRRNRVLDIGNQADSISTKGIQTNGVCDILDNTVAGVVAQVGSGKSAYGIDIVSGAGIEVAGNHVSGLRGDGVGTALAIYIGQSPDAVLRDNILIGEGSGSGVKSLSADLAYATGNLVLGYSTGISGVLVGDNIVQ